MSRVGPIGGIISANPQNKILAALSSKNLSKERNLPHYLLAQLKEGKILKNPFLYGRDMIRRDQEGEMLKNPFLYGRRYASKESTRIRPLKLGNIL